MVSFGQSSLFCQRTSQITPSNVWLPVAKKMPVQHAWLNQQNEAHLSVLFYESKQRHWRSSANSHSEKPDEHSKATSTGSQNHIRARSTCHIPRNLGTIDGATICNGLNLVTCKVDSIEVAAVGVIVG
jgi:hypothetical protein